MAATQSSARAAVVRSALLFSPFLAVALLGFILIARDGLRNGWNAGTIIGLLLLGAVVLLLGFQVVQSARDIFAQPVETSGLIERRWSRNEFLILHNTYVFVEKDVFRLSPEQAIDIELGDAVHIVHLPHTSTVVSIERVRKESAASSNG